MKQAVSSLADRRWKSRYFVLYPESQCIVYFKDDHSIRPKGIYHLNDTSELLTWSGSTAQSSTKNVAEKPSDFKTSLEFKIKTRYSTSEGGYQATGKVLSMKAASEKDKSKWIEKLKDLIAHGADSDSNADVDFELECGLDEAGAHSRQDSFISDSDSGFVSTQEICNNSADRGDSFSQGQTEEAKPERVVFWENQRWQPLRGFGSSYPGHLHPHDPPKYCDDSGTVRITSGGGSDQFPSDYADGEQGYRWIDKTFTVDLQAPDCETSTGM
jgi:hypothetical protein